MLGRLFGYGKKKKEKEGDKNYDPKSKYRQGLLESPVTTYSEGEMKTAKRIVARKPTQPEYSSEKMRSAGPHMEIIGSYDPKLGKPPRQRSKKNRSRRNKTPTNRKYLDKRPEDPDYRYHTPEGKRKTSYDMIREDIDPFEFMGGKTRKRRRKRRRKTKRKGRRKTKKRRKRRKRKTRRKR